MWTTDFQASNLWTTADAALPTVGSETVLKELIRCLFARQTNPLDRLKPVSLFKQSFSKRRQTDIITVFLGSVLTMQIAIMLTIVLLVFFWVIADAPRRKHHKEHVAPLEAQLANVRADMAREEREASKARDDRNMFSRDFGAEIARARRNLDDAYARLEPLKQEKASLIDDHQRTCRKLKAWYNQANGTWFGNGGQKLPRHAIFSQDTSDRDGMKARRDRLSREIDEAKEAISRFYRDEIEPSKKAIGRANAAKARLIELQRAGYEPRHFRKIEERHEAQIARHRLEEGRLEAAIIEAKEQFKTNRNVSFW